MSPKGCRIRTGVEARFASIRHAVKLEEDGDSGMKVDPVAIVQDQIGRSRAISRYAFGTKSPLVASRRNDAMRARSLFRIRSNTDRSIQSCPDPASSPSSALPTRS
jgi:hypothetical protein